MKNWSFYSPAKEPPSSVCYKRASSAKWPWAVNSDPSFVLNGTLIGIHASTHASIFKPVNVFEPITSELREDFFNFAEILGVVAEVIIKGGKEGKNHNCLFPFGGQMCAVIIAVQFSLWTRWPPVNRNHSLVKCPMHCQCTADTLPKVLECRVLLCGAVHLNLVVWVWLALDCHWKVICFVLEHLPSGLPVKSGLPLWIQTGGIQCSRIAIEKSFVLCSGAQSSKEPLHTAMTLNNHHFMSTFPFSPILILPSDFPAAQNGSAGEQTRNIERKRGECGGTGLLSCRWGLTSLNLFRISKVF